MHRIFHFFCRIWAAMVLITLNVVLRFSVGPVSPTSLLADNKNEAHPLKG